MTNKLPLLRCIMRITASGIKYCLIHTHAHTRARHPIYLSLSLCILLSLSLCIPPPPSLSPPLSLPLSSPFFLPPPSLSIPPPLSLSLTLFLSLSLTYFSQLEARKTQLTTLLNENLLRRQQELRQETEKISLGAYSLYVYLFLLFLSFVLS